MFRSWILVPLVLPWSILLVLSAHAQTDLGACCLDNGVCTITTFEECLAQEEEGACVWMEGVLECEPNPCPACCPVACCLPDGQCVALWCDEECEDAGGTIVGYFCENHTCPQPAIACCLPDGSYREMTEEECVAADGEAMGYPSDCDPNPCETTDVEETPRSESTWGRIKSHYR